MSFIGPGGLVIYQTFSQRHINYDFVMNTCPSLHIQTSNRGKGTIKKKKRSRRKKKS
jgi:hypothetical protein